MTPSALLQLQRTVGNAAVNALLGEGGRSPASLRADRPTPPTRVFMEPPLGHDYRQAREAADYTAGVAAPPVQAHSHTMGQDIVGDRPLDAQHAIQQDRVNAVTQDAPAVQRTESKNSNMAGVAAGSSLQRAVEVQRLSLDDVVSFLEWSNPVTFWSKAIRAFSGLDVDLFSVAEQAVRASATKITIPSNYVKDLKRYAQAVSADGDILNDALAQGPSYYEGGWLLSVNSGAEAMTFGNSIFFSAAPPNLDTYIHEMVHIHQYHSVGRTAFLTTYFGLSLGTILKRIVLGQPVNPARSNPYEEAAYNLENRFHTWLAANP